MSSSPQLQQQQQQQQQQQLLDVSEIKSNPSSPPELAQMTNVDVLDLHKDYSGDTKIYDKESNTLYVYTNNKSATIDSSPPPLQMTTSSVGNTTISIQENGINNRLMQQQHDIHMIQTTSDGQLDADDPILRIVGENQQIISRDIINGEHHIITRNENGEHILTRIVNALPHPTNHPTNDQHKLEMYESTDPDQIPASVLHYEKSDKDQQIHYTTTSNGSLIEKPQIIYTHADANGHYENLTAEEKAQIDLIYEEGGKTVIYTTSGDQKGLEIYSGSDLSNLINEGQVVVQGGIQYTTQQSGGSGMATVYLVESVSDDINGQQIHG
jgi:hypothetical protein